MVQILVIDDELDILQLLVEDLTDQGYDVISAVDGGDGLKKIYLHRPDLVLLDMMMPVLTGYDVLRTIRGDPTIKDLPVILLSVLDPADAERIVRELGAIPYVTKPWSQDILDELIKVAIGEGKASGWINADDPQED